MSPSYFPAFSMILLAAANHATCCLRESSLATGASGSDAGFFTDTAISAGLNLALGGSISAREWPSGSTGDYIQSQADVSCNFQSTNCGWRNEVELDELDFVEASGKPDADRWKFSTGTSQLPEEPFLVAASYPRASTDRAILASEPIACQTNDARVTFRHWVSRARTDAQRPRLRLCLRESGQTELLDCREVRADNPGPSEVLLKGPRKGPFEFLFVVDNFVNTPEGAFVALDNIVYIGRVSRRPADCDKNDDPLITTTRRPTATTALDFGAKDRTACAAVACAFDEEPCRWKVVGDGSTGLGKSSGWVFANGFTNRANPLTGIKIGPGNDQNKYFAVADFSRGRIGSPPDRYVLESPSFEMSGDRVLSFRRYLSTVGLSLRICRDADGDDCPYISKLLFTNDQVMQNRRWQQEMVFVPEGEQKMYMIAEHSRGQRSRHVGQIGITDMTITDLSDQSIC